MSNFITNSDTKTLKNRLLQLVSKSAELKFLVGFFYFSGISELYEGLKNNQRLILKVLVGLNVDIQMYGIVEHGEAESRLSDDEKVNNFFQSIKKSINTEDFDNKDFYEQCKFFIELILQNRLIIRKTYEPNHAKLYIFKLEETEIRSSLFITGSSNLTRAGLSSQYEFNVEISDYGVNEAEEYFEKLWDRAVQITEKDELKQKLIKIIQEETLIREITPFEAYVIVLKSYLDTFKGANLNESLKKVLEENNYKIFNYQLDAVSQAISIIDQHNGVIIADVVGLGKTVIACAICYQLKKRGIVIAPPGLIGDQSKTAGWNKYLEDFKLVHLGWEAHSLGKLKDVYDFVKKANDIEVVIIDEAHRFRNEDTKDYELLKNICRGKKVILLTATPFNNKPQDIFALLKLFVMPKKSDISLTDNLQAKFSRYKTLFDKLSYIKKYHNSNDSKKQQKAVKNYKDIFGDNEINLTKVVKKAKELASEVRNVIEPVLIRRNRLDLKANPKYKYEIRELSVLEDPIEWFYELSQEQSEFYDEVIGSYFSLPDQGGRFKGAIYQPFIYEKGEIGEKEDFEYYSQFNLYDFMRRLLVKRFESSVGAFKQTLLTMLDLTENILQFVKKTNKYVLDRSLLEKILTKDENEIEGALKEYSEKIQENNYPKNHKIYEINKFKNKNFIPDIESDLRIFNELLDKLRALNFEENDPKRETLIEKLKKQFQKEPERKIVIFTEYVDTVFYLKPHLEKAFNNRVLSIHGNINQSNLTALYDNFDASYEKQRNDFDVLLTTDRISEGFNLNRAGMVINYDIPWNPVRVIQRVGRINRINKKVFDKLYIVNFFPTVQGADIIRSQEIASNKMFMIHNTLGEDAKIFSPDEEPSPSGLYKKIQQNPEELEGESFFTKIFREYEEIKSKHPEVVKGIKDFPKRIKVAKKGVENELIVVIKKGRIYIHHKKYDEKNNNHNTVSLEEVINKIKAEPEEKALPLSHNFWQFYDEIKKIRENLNSRTSELSLEQRAKNVLYSLLRDNNNEKLTNLKPFIKTLLEDIIDYGTLSDFTLRRIAEIDVDKNPEIEIESLKEELGEDYLIKEKQRLKELKKEIIVAIENIANEKPTDA